MLLLGGPALARLVPGSPDYGAYLDRACALSGEQVTTFFFMLSHYIADCFMPCHADKRALSAFASGGVHEGWERHWEDLVGADFTKARLKASTRTSAAIIAATKTLDQTLDLEYPLPLGWHRGSGDIWDTAIFWCRASFAFASEVFPLDQYPYTSRKQPRFQAHFADQAALVEYDRIVLQSAAYAVASTWKQIWRKFKT